MNIKRHHLAIPLFPLYNYKSLEEIHLEDREVEYLLKYYQLDERQALYKDLKWAKNNPDFNFESIMEGTPVVGNLKFSNEEVYEYLMSFMAFMEQFSSILTKITPKHEY